MAQRSPSKRLADLHLGVSVESFIAEQRAAGTSYRLIARALFTATQGAIDVTDATVRTWHLQADEAAPELRAATA